MGRNDTNTREEARHLLAHEKFDISKDFVYTNVEREMRQICFKECLDLCFKTDCLIIAPFSGNNKNLMFG